MYGYNFGSYGYGVGISTSLAQALIDYRDWNTTTSSEYVTDGVELVTNGDFSNGLTSWAIDNGLAQTVEVVNNRLHIVSDGSLCAVSQYPLGSVAGVFIVIDIEILSGYAVIQTGDNIKTISESGTYSFYQVSTNTAITLKRGTAGVATEFYINNVSIQKVIQEPNKRYLRDVGSTPTYNASMYFGIGAYLNGVDQGINTTVGASASGSVLLQVSTTSTLAQGYLFCNSSQSNRCYVAVTSGTLSIGLASSNLDSEYSNTSVIINDGLMKNIALTWSSGIFDVFINGIKIHTGQYSGIVSTSPMSIGTNPYGATKPVFMAKDIFMFNRVLNQSEITQSYEQPEAFYAMAQADSTCVLNMPMCENDGYVRDMKNYSVGSELLDNVTLDGALYSPYQSSATIDTLVYNSGSNSIRFSSNNVGTSLFGRVLDSSIKIIGKYYKIGVYIKTLDISNLNVYHAYTNSTNRTNMVLISTNANGWSLYECIAKIEDISSQFYFSAYGTCLTPNSAIWIDGGASVKKLSGIHPITNYTSSVRDNAKNLQYGLQTCKFVRDSLGVIQSASDYLECDGVGYANTGWIPSASEDWTIEQIRGKDTFQMFDGIWPTTSAQRVAIGTEINGAIRIDIGSISKYISLSAYSNIKTYIVVSYKYLSKTVVIYENGIEKHNFVTNLATGTNTFPLGKRSDNLIFSNAVKRLFKVHNKALTQEEITANYNSYVAKGLLS